MTTQDPNSVWYQTVDDGEYQCQVMDTPGGEGYSGVLTITNDGVVIHRETVSIAYAARFGPDVDDVATWQERSLDVIDHPEKRTL